MRKHDGLEHVVIHLVEPCLFDGDGIRRVGRLVQIGKRAVVTCVRPHRHLARHSGFALELDPKGLGNFQSLHALPFTAARRHLAGTVCLHSITVQPHPGAQAKLLAIDPKSGTLTTD